MISRLISGSGKTQLIASLERRRRALWRCVSLTAMLCGKRKRLWDPEKQVKTINQTRNRGDARPPHKLTITAILSAVLDGPVMLWLCCAKERLQSFYTARPSSSSMRTTTADKENDNRFCRYFLPQLLVLKLQFVGALTQHDNRK